MVTLNQPVKNFVLPSTGGKEFSLADHAGRNLVIYFYPKDDTPGCTLEGQDFLRNWHAFIEKNSVIVGISSDEIESHEKFKEKMQFPFDLLSDTDGIACRLFDVIKKKTVDGKENLSIERSTFVVDSEGVLRKEWRGVKVPGHVQEVLDFIYTM